MDDSTAITAGFGVLVVGVAVILAGVFLGGELTLVGAGSVLMVTSVAGFVYAASGEAHHEDAAAGH